MSPEQLFFPALAPVYAALAPVIEALLRVAVGLCLVPHGLRMTFGLFASTGFKVRSLPILAKLLDEDGYRPGRFWAPAIALTELVAGPLLAAGLLTRLAAIPILIFLLVTCRERWIKGGWFWNDQGLEYTLMWTLAVAYFLIHGGGVYSLDHLIGRAF